MNTVNGPVFGSYGLWNFAPDVARDRKLTILARVLNVCGYIPIVSLVSGVARLGIIVLVGCPRGSDETKLAVSWCVRGVFEVCQVGSPFIMLDIMISSVRSRLCRKEKAAAL